MTRWAWGRHPPKAFKTEQGVRRAGLGLVQALDWAPRNRISGAKERNKSLVPEAAKWQRSVSGTQKGRGIQERQGRPADKAPGSPL